MKLSEMTTEKACDVLCELTPYIENICKNEKFSDFLNEQTKAKTNKEAEQSPKTIASLFQKYTPKATAIVSVFLGDCRKDTFRLLAIINDKTADEIAKQNLMTTAGQISDLIQDEEFIDFFSQFVPLEKTK